MNNKKVVFRYAYVAGERITPSKGLHGTCPLCKMPVISKCGNKKVWHWAHCDIGNCDHWWENKTDWHEHWQDKFPPEWQEYIIENNNICHRADIYTDSGIVVEFQHSKLSEEEIEKREKFYIKNSNDMVWVVTLNKRNTNRFLELIENDYIKFPPYFYGIPINIGKHYLNIFHEWQNRPVCVFFDFRNFDLQLQNDKTDKIYCLMPQRVSFCILHETKAILTYLTISEFIKIISNYNEFKKWQEKVYFYGKQAFDSQIHSKRIGGKPIDFGFMS